LVERAADFEVPVPLDPAPVPVGEFEPVVVEPVVVEFEKTARDLISQYAFT